MLSEARGARSSLASSCHLASTTFSFGMQVERTTSVPRRLFRLEEYKLPEFKVQVKTPEQDGKKKAFRLGEKVEVEIQADYYFGGPVSSASVEVVVYQKPFYHYWFPRREYAWYYAEFHHYRRPRLR